MFLMAFAISLPISIPLMITLVMTLLTLLVPLFGTISILGTNQSPKLPTGFLNSANGDPAPGVPLASPSGSIVQAYFGQVGGKLSIDTTEASGLSDPATATLFAGMYQYVQFASGSTASNARGQVVFWLTAASFIVTPDVTAATQGLIAGITLAAVTKGNYGWIQIQGRASVKYKSSLTAATPAAGDLIILDQAPSNAADDPTQSGSPTYLILKSMIGVADVLPVGGSVLAVDLCFWNDGWRY
jgi:hypothetical protein